MDRSIHYIISPADIRLAKIRKGTMMDKIRPVANAGATAVSLPERVLLDVIAHHLMDIVMVTDATVDEPGPRVLYVNDRFTELTGYAADEVVGRSPRLLQGRDTDRAALERVRQAIDQGVAVTETVANYARDGTRYELEMRIMPVVDRTGKPTYFVSIQRDVTRYVQRRVGRERVELLLATVVNAVDFGMLVLDADGRCVIATRPLLAQLGKRASEVIGNDFSAMFADLDEKSVDRARAGEHRIFEATPLDGRQRLRFQILHGLPNVDRFTVLRVTAGVPVAEARRREVEDSSRQVVGGRLQFVGLDTVRKQLGEKWREHTEAVFALAQGVLRRRLGPRDAWQRSGDDGFVVAFAGLDERTARFRAAAIADEITQTLVGSGATDIGCTSRVAEMAAAVEGGPLPGEGERSPDFGKADLLAEIERHIEQAAAAHEQRLRRQLAASLENPTVHVDRVRLLRVDTVIAGRLRFDPSLEDELLAVRQSFDDAPEVLLDAYSSLLARAVDILSADDTDRPRPLMVPIDPTITESRRAWTQLLDLSRRIPSMLRKRITPLIDNAKADISPYRISDIANTLGQIFNRPGLVHPPRHPLRFNSDRCRLRVVVFRGDELPAEGADDKQLAKLLGELRTMRIAVGVDGVRRHAPDTKAYPPHEFLIEAAA